MVNQLSGPMVNLPQFLTDQHQIVDDKSLSRYISRLQEFVRVIGEVKVRVMDAKDNGTVPPDFILKKHWWVCVHFPKPRAMTTH